MRWARALVGAGAILCGTVPAVAQDAPLPGVVMVRDGRGTMLVADLCAPGISVRATRYVERRATPQAWATRGDVNAQAAVNGDFYDFPSAASISGRARGAGEDWPPGTQNVNPEVRSYWQFGAHAAALVEPSTLAPPPPPAVTEIVGAHNVIIRGGRSLAPLFDGDAVILGAHARTAVGLSADRRFLYLFSTRTAMTGPTLADAVLEYAARAARPWVDIATNMDGGGSAQMYVAGLGQVVDSGRPVANHLGIRATGAGAAPQCPRVDCPDGQTNPPGDLTRCVPRTDFRVFLADFDGDRRSDLVTVSPSAAGAWAEWFAVERSTGTGFAFGAWPARTAARMRSGVASSRYRVVLGDFDGDARADLLTISPNATGDWAQRVSVERSTGNGFASATWPTPTPQHMRNGDPLADYRVLVGDFNGDGRSDLATISRNGGGGWAANVYTDLSTGDGFASSGWAAATPGHMRNGDPNADYRAVVGDFNGDGRSDLATISRNGGGGWADWVAMELSTGSGFRSTPWSAATPAHMRNGDPNADYQVLVGDFNGDGRSDLATISRNGGGGWADWVAMELSAGEGFRSTVWASPTPRHMRNGGPDAGYRVLVGDFDGDGRSDLVTLSPNAGGGWADWASLDLSTGSGFRSTPWSAATPGHMRRGGPNADYRVLVGDVNADGRSDLVTLSPNGGGGWADWASVELDTGGGFASATWTAPTAAHIRNGTVTELAWGIFDASRAAPRRAPPPLDAGAPVDASARDVAALDRPRVDAGARPDIVAPAEDLGPDPAPVDAGDLSLAPVVGACGCRAAGASHNNASPLLALLLALRAASRRTSPPAREGDELA